MLQVTFRGVLPTTDVAAQLRAAYTALCTANQAPASEDVRLSVTLSQREEPQLRYAAAVEWVDAAGAVTRAETAAHQLTFALRSALSVIAAGSIASQVDREYARRLEARARSAEHEISPLRACVGA